MAEFTPAVLNEIIAVLAAAASVDPASVDVAVAAGSVVLSVVIRAPTADAATAAGEAIAPQIASPGAATTLLAGVSSLPITVEAVTPVADPTLASSLDAIADAGSSAQTAAGGGGVQGVLIGGVVAACAALLIAVAAVTILHSRRVKPPTAVIGEGVQVETVASKASPQGESDEGDGSKI